MRRLVESSGSRLVCAHFVKRDGELRQMVFHPRYTAHIKGPLASPSAQRAVATRRANNPNLLNVFDFRKMEARSVNMDTLVQIRVNGVTYVRRGDSLEVWAG